MSEKILTPQPEAADHRWYNNKILPLLILLSGFIYAIFLLLQTRDGVFFSGDGGLKFLQTKQFASGYFGADVRLQGPAWVRELWVSGLYPFKPPFSYDMDGGHYFDFPLYFSLVSAPWYSILGFKGLYVLPTLALFGTWFAVYYLCRRLRLGILSTSIALFALIFSSPLTLYGATFWEHTLGVTLAFWGVIILLAPVRSSRARWSTLIAGMLVGLSAWFRSEMLCFGGCAVIVTWMAPRLGFNISHRRAFSVGFVAALAGLVAANLAIYRHPFGFHALQVFRPLSLTERLSDAVTNFGRMTLLLVTHFPFIVPAAISGIVATLYARRDGNPDQKLRLLPIICVLFICTVPAILPSPSIGGDGGMQWGPRYLLIAVPVFSAVAAIAFPEIWRRTGTIPRFALGLAVSGTLVYGAFLNTVIGPQRLRENYAGRVLPALEVIRADPSQVVIVTNQCIAQELAATMAEKGYILANNVDELEMVVRSALENGQSRLLLLTFYDMSMRANNTSTPDGRRRAFVRISPRGVYGSYTVHDLILGWSSP